MSTLLRARVFKKSGAGKFCYHNTAFVPDKGRFEGVLDGVPDVRPGDIVYALDLFFMKKTVEGWADLPADDPRVGGLYAQAVEAEAEMVDSR